jgi:hypothetical protein
MTKSEWKAFGETAQCGALLHYLSLLINSALRELEAEAMSLDCDITDMRFIGGALKELRRLRADLTGPEAIFDHIKEMEQEPKNV